MNNLRNPKTTDMRRKAAAALRDARREDRPQKERDVDRQIARAYKGLADNEEWLSRNTPNKK